MTALQKPIKHTVHCKHRARGSLLSDRCSVKSFILLGSSPIGAWFRIHMYDFLSSPLKSLASRGDRKGLRARLTHARTGTSTSGPGGPDAPTWRVSEARPTEEASCRPGSVTLTLVSIGASLSLLTLASVLRQAAETRERWSRCFSQISVENKTGRFIRWSILF